MAETSQGQNISISNLRAEVCSARGTTISGIHALEKGGFRASVMDAVTAASERSRVLSQL